VPISPNTTSARDTTILDTEMDVWQRTLDVNLLGYVRTIQAVLPTCWKEVAAPS